MKKLISLLLVFLMLACSTPKETVIIMQDSSGVVIDSTKVKMDISDEDKTGYIIAVAIVGFIVVSLIGLSNLIPPAGP